MLQIQLATFAYVAFSSVTRVFCPLRLGLYGYTIRVFTLRYFSVLRPWLMYSLTFQSEFSFILTSAIFTSLIIHSSL